MVLFLQKTSKKVRFVRTLSEKLLDLLPVKGELLSFLGLERTNVLSNLANKSWVLTMVINDTPLALQQTLVRFQAVKMSWSQPILENLSSVLDEFILGYFSTSIVLFSIQLLQDRWC